ncbi:MAG: AAA family ATPase [Gemmataceae bacterium]|nr:AAA family ATPase [Gemmataceae bacterium]
MAKKKPSGSDTTSSIPAPAIMPTQPMPQAMPMHGMPMQPGMMPQGMPQGMPGMMPGAMPGQNNPMFAMMHMMQMMMGGGLAPSVVDPSALPFTGTGPVNDGDQGLDADIIRPSLLDHRIKVQKGVPMGSVLDHLCLSEDRQHALGGIPKGCTIALAGPPGKGKTRTALAGLSRVANAGSPVAFVVAEEGFHNDEESGRDDLCSRLTKIGMTATGLSEAQFSKNVLERMFVLQSQYHKGQSWDDFVTKYRYLVEKENIRFVVIDSLNMLDPTKNRTADNLSALKTYNHEKGITCICIGQIRDTGQPVGGEALMHTADAVFLIEEMGLGSKEIADFWGGKYRDKIEVIHAVKSVTTPVLPYPVRVDRDPTTGVLTVHPAQPRDYPVLPPKG